MHDLHFFGGGWMMFFWWLLLIALIVVLLRPLFKSKRPEDSNETPLEILNRRYAEGEIDKKEFEQRKKDLLQ